MSTSKTSKKTMYMKVIVSYCIAFISMAAITTIIGAWFHVYLNETLTIICGVFGGELLLTCVIKLIGAKPEDTVKPAIKINEESEG